MWRQQPHHHHHRRYAFALSFVALLAAQAASALPAADDSSSAHLAARNTVTGTENDLMDGIYSDCLRKDSVNCIKYKLFSFVDKMVDQRDAFALTEGVTVVKTTGADATVAAASAEGAPRAAGADSIDAMIVSRVQNFLQSHTLKVDLKGADVVNAVSATGRALSDVSEALFFDGGVADSADSAVSSMGESRKKKKHGKILGPLLLALGLKAAALLPLILGGIALIAGKALLIGKIALVLSAVIGLKKLLSQEKHVTYEVVAHPHHSTSHSASHDAYASGSGYSSDVAAAGGAGYGSSGHGGWGRSVDVHDMAYGAQKPLPL